MISQLAANSLVPMSATTLPEKLWRVVHVVPSVSPSKGGPANVVVRMAAAQAALGHEVTIISSLKTSDRDAFEQAVRNVPNFGKVRLLISPWTSTLANWVGARVSPLYRSLFPFVDVVHIHGVWESMIVRAAKDAHRLGVPYIVRPCGMLDPWSLAHHGWRKRFAMTISHRQMLNRAAALQALNKVESQLIGPLNLTAPHVVIPNGVSLDEVDSGGGDSEFLSKADGLGDKRFVLFVGRLEYKKGLDFLAQGFARIAAAHRDVDLVVVGPADNALKPFLEAIEKAKLTSRVHVIGPLYGDAKFAAYRRATCFCLPSRQEGFSLAIAEAMASRTPAAVSTECHFEEVGSSGAGIVFDLHAGAVGDALNKMLSATPRQCEQMGQAGRALVEKHYTWNRIAQQTAAMYATVVQMGRGRPRR